MSASLPSPQLTKSSLVQTMRRFWRNVGVNIVLFVATVLGILWWHQDLVEGATYAAGLLSILLAHEFGHYFAARRHGVEVTLPYFIPGFPPLYTFGAFIRMHAPRMSRRALLHIGAAGPLAGAAVAIPVYVLGIMLSQTVAMPPMVPPNTFFTFGDSLLSSGITWLVFGDLPEGVDVMLHPLAHAGWVGLFVTAFNLIPVGQLDGGHVGYAVFGRDYAHVSRWLFRGLLLCGVFFSPIWLTLSLFLLFTGVEHPPIISDEPLSPRARAVGYGCMALFVATFMPSPFEQDGLLALVLRML